MAAHLWTNGPAPPEWLVYILCSKFHRLPSEIKAEPYPHILDLLSCMETEHKVEEKRRNAKKLNKR